MSNLADKIRELKATKQFSDVDLHQMAAPPALEKLRDSIALALSHLEGQRVFSAAEILQAILTELEPKAPPPRTCQEEQD